MIHFQRDRFKLLPVPYGAGLNGVAEEKLVPPNIEVAAGNFRLD